jgi:hypothetical protein
LVIKGLRRKGGAGREGGPEKRAENGAVWQEKRGGRRIIFTFAFLLFLYESRFYPDFARVFLRLGGPFFGMQIVPTIRSGFLKGVV